jgi:hypothetical protein
MKIYTNERIIRRNAMLGKIFGFSGFGGLVIALLLSFYRPDLANTLLVAALISSLFAQVGISLYSQWGQRPRIDELLDDAFKGLDDRYTIFHYALGPAHSIATPCGVFAVLPYLEKGEIRYEDEQYWAYLARRGLLRRPGRKLIKRVSKSAQDDVEALSRGLTRHLKQDADELDIQLGAMLVFVNDEADLQLKDAPLDATHIKKAKDFIRRLPKAKSLSESDVETLVSSIGL